LAELAAELGSDVPFFLDGGPAICRGRGERIEPVRGLPPLDVVVVKPAVGVSTAAAFEALGARDSSPISRQDSQARLNRLVDKLRSGAVAASGRLMSNRLQQTAQRLCPAITSVLRMFGRTDSLGHVMTGSGSAVYAVMRTARQARAVAQLISAQLLGNVERHLSSSPEGFRTTVFAASTCRAASSPSLGG
jgi:4-diphosphocytidyl-2-C-methyl-D-erythritol kinase